MAQQPDHIQTDSVTVHGTSHTGLVKPVNEDRFLIRRLDGHRTLLAVADGLGGGFNGDAAAQTAVDDLKTLSLPPGKNRETALLKTVHAIDGHICREIEKRPELEGMATTLVCGVLDRDMLSWVNVGDSRLYLKRGNALSRITEDQTLARFLIDEGEITAEQARTHYSKDLLDQCVGYGECDPAAGTLAVKDGDLLLFATDGLHKPVPDEQICRILNRPEPPEQMADSLIRSALDKGGPDNVTVILVRIHPG